MHEVLQDLNPQQREAVLYTEGPLMIIAGAGSGKTKVLTSRIAYLLSKGVNPFNILALTFTNKAAKEMKERVQKILKNNQALNLYIGTYHSVFARILRFEAAQIGYPSNFTIYDTDDAKSLLKSIINQLNLDEKKYKVSSVLHRISEAKNNLISPKQYQENPKIQQQDLYRQQGAFGKVYEIYTNECIRNGAMDFDDLLVNMHRLITQNPECLLKYQHKFKYILIDEYQDTNYLQYQITKLLAAANENICIVGDDAQSIYSFRGAVIENILNFDKDYDNVKRIILEQNYRSEQNIIGAANAIIKNNKSQIPKHLWTSIPAQEKIKYLQNANDTDESRKIVDIIKEQSLRHHYEFNQFAILYRTNAQSRTFEESLRRQNVPYKIYGGISFYQRKEIKDVLAYLRILANPQDNEQLKRIINIPARGIGKTTIEKCLTIAAEKNISFYEVLLHPLQHDFRQSTAKSLENFTILIQYLRTLFTKQNAYEIAETVCKQSGLLKELLEDRSVEGVARFENVQELLNSIKEWTELPDAEGGELIDKSLGAYLQQITLLTDADSDSGEDINTVKLMTIHAAKGLEFSCVFIVGLEEGLFPNSQTVEKLEDLEEERRLFYVAITRAKAKLWLANATSRYKFGQITYNEASRFIEEIPPEFIEKFVGKSNYFNEPVNKPSHYVFEQKKAGTISNKNYENPIDEKPSMNAKLISSNSNGVFHQQLGNYKSAQKVNHPKFGFGTIINLEGDAHNPIAHIKFDKNPAEIKRIFLQYAKLELIN
ncbi:MAG: UvrD-helicase domain-containing protein [Sediminibacterium sp.]|nr:UvrD-helicase domain-containing protein [Sediminibacterium sp.]